MKKRGNIQKLTSFFLVFVMLLGVMLQSKPVFAEDVDRVNTKITKFEIKDKDGKTIPPGKPLGYWSKFRLEMDWDASSYGKTLKKGDYFIIQLPKQFKFPTEPASAVNFPLYAAGVDTVARAHVNSNGEAGGGTVKITFTDYVQNRENIKGNIFLEAIFARKNINAGQDNQITVSIGGVPFNIKVLIGPKPTLNNEVFVKWGEKVPGDVNKAKWILRINHKKGHFNNVVVKDELFVSSGALPPGIHYLKDTFELKEVEIDEYGIIKKNIKTYNYEQLKNHIKFLDNDTKFEFNLSGILGNTSGRQFSMTYNSTYIPQLRLKNKGSFTSKEEKDSSSSHFLSAQAGGGGQGDLNQKIKIIKIDEEDNTKKLANAKFKITKVADGSSFELTTDANGEAVSPKLDPGKYKIKEIGAPTGYIPDGKEYDLNIVGGESLFYTVKNKRSKVKINVEKAWEDKNDQDGVRPNSVTIKLLADGKETGKTLTLTKADNWTGSFTDLDEYKAGKKIEYTIKEESVGNGYVSVITGSAEDGYKVTNTREPEKVKVEGKKTWNDKDNQDGKRPAEITINLLKNGTKINSVKVKEADGWKWKFEGLDKYENGKEITYSITEEQVDGYSVEINGYDVKNSYTPGKTSVQVTKVWEDKNDQDGVRPNSVTIKLLADGKETGKTLTLTKADNWTGTFTDLDEYKEGKKIVYTVEEVKVKDYETVITGDQEKGFTITNIRIKPWTPMIPPTRNIKVKKDWKLLTAEKPVDKIEVELYKDGVATGKKLELNKNNNWIGEFKNLEVANGLGNINYHKYTVKEVGEKFYAIQLVGKWYGVSYTGNMKDGFTITNKEKTPWTPMIPPTRNIKVTKNWKLLTAEKPVDKIEVELYKDGVATGKKLVLTKDNNWIGEFKNLEVANGLGNINYHKYTVKEVGEIDKAIKLDGKVFIVSYEGDMKTGFKIINKEKPPVQPKNPNTSDNFTNMTFISITIISALGLGYISLNKNKKINR
ncbi:Cna B-type domain-containing protein [Helcococcus ovis]